MKQNIFEACLPWAILIVAGVICARALVQLSGAKLELSRLKTLHKSEKGSVQSLSFILTLPFFLMIVMMIIQASHIMTGNIVVNYAAFATVRSASVWIPANVDLYETSNRISSISLIDSAPGSQQYEITPEGPKFSKIQTAATLACVSLGPSRDFGYGLTSDQEETASALTSVFNGMSPLAQSKSGLVPQRIRNKLAYSYQNTTVRLTAWHREGDNARFVEPPLQIRYNVPPYLDEYYFNELGWQDELAAEVTYNLPLLPGPIRFFAPLTGSRPSVDLNGESYTWPITATATMALEGEKPVTVFWQGEN